MAETESLAKQANSQAVRLAAAEMLVNELAEMRAPAALQAARQLWAHEAHQVAKLVLQAAYSGSYPALADSVVLAYAELSASVGEKYAPAAALARLAQAEHAE